MRLTTVILIASFLQVSASTFGQKITLKQENTPLRAVLKEIRRQSGYDIFYDGKTIPAKQRVSVQLSEAPIKEALDKVLGDLNVTYQINNKEITIKEKEEPSFLDRVTAYFASISVRGSVVDENGQPMAGVTVSVKNGKISVSTDSYGGFYLKSVDENAVLILSFLGYVPQEIPVNGRDGLGVIKMKLSESKLDEVQIQAYGKTSKRLSTSNITTVKADDIAKQPVDNPLYALMGRVPGLTISPSSGMAGAPVEVQLRGQNSLSTLDSEPLFVVDGIPVINNMDGTNPYATSYGFDANGKGITQISALSYLNPRDIESIDVLKDADATAIYGSRGANGVILITTKKGKIGEMRINGAFQTSLSYLNERYNLMNTQQYLEMRRQAYINDGLPIPDPSINGSEKNRNNFDLTVWDPNRYTDWQTVFLGGVAKSYNANASISGGSAIVQYMISGDFNKQGYIFPGDANAINGSGRVNISGSSPDNKFRANLSAVYTGASSIAPVDFSGLAYTLPPNAPALYDVNGQINWQPNPGSAAGEATWKNPYANLLNPLETNTNTMQASLYTSYTIKNGLNLKIQTGLSRIDFHSFKPFPIIANDPILQNSVKGSTITNDNLATTFSVEPQIDYTAKIFKGKLNVLLGGSYQGESRNSQEIEQGNFSSDALLRSLKFGTNTGANSTSFDYRYLATFGRINYSWDDRYILNLTGRRDGSSKYGPGHQFGNFGSIGGAWVFTNERFLQKSKDVLSFGKIRATYGTNGNDGIGAYQYIQLFYADQGKYQNAPLLATNGPANPDYHWESKKSLELGLDLGFFSDRVSFSGSYFRSRSSEQLLSILLPATASGSILTVNDASTKIQNTGYEISLNSKNITSANFSWTTNFSVSFLNKNKILEGEGILPARLFDLYGTNESIKIENLIGKPFAGIVATYEYRGIDPTTGWYQFTALDGSAQSANAYDYGSLNRFAKIVDVNPKYYGGISNQISYKGFSLDIFLQFTKQMGKNPLLNASGNPGMFSGTSGNFPVEFLDSWQPGKTGAQQRTVSGFGNIENFLTANNNALIARFSDAAWTDASFLRVKNVALSYQFPESLTKKIKMNSLTLGINAQNLFTFSSYKGLDPEAQSVQSMPPLSTLAFRVQIGL